MTDAIIRRAEPGDMPALVDLATRFYATDGYDTDAEALPARLDKMRGDPQSAVFVSEIEGEGVIGFITILITQGLEFGCKGEVEALFVRTKVRGQRIGTRLLDAGCQWASEQGAEEMFLVIAAQGEPVRQLEQLYLGRDFVPSRRTLMYRGFSR